MIKATIEYSYIEDGSYVYRTLIEQEADLIYDIELPGAARSRITCIFKNKEHFYQTLHKLNTESKCRVSLVRYKNIKGV